MSSSPLGDSAKLERSLGLARASLSRISTNGYIKSACLSFSATVFIAWQYALRDERTLLADATIWQSIDRRLPQGALDRVRRFLDKNFYLRPGDERQRPWALVTSAFSHISFGHFVANALSFNAFSELLMIFLPPVHFCGVILASALAGSAAFLVQQSRKKFPNRRIRALGMSAVTSGMGAMAAYLFPQAPASIYGIKMPMWAAFAGYFAWDAFFLESERSTTGHAAHLGGALAGLIYGACLTASGVIRTRRFRS